MKIKKFISQYKTLLLILLVAAILRLWKLGSIPPGLTPDEASLGYNAYSLLKTGRDEYGQLLPVIFKSFGDYKPGFYVYLTVPSVAILGLNEYATRLPSAISGILAVWLIFLIIKEFDYVEKLKIKESVVIGNYKLKICDIAAFMLAISPWHIQFSRGAWEANVSLTLCLAGIYFFLRSLRSITYILLSAILFSLTFITYQGAKLSTSIVLIILILVFRKHLNKFIKNIKIILVSALIGFIICLPIVSSLFIGKTGRLTVFSVFSYPRPAEYLQQFLDEGSEKVGSLTYYLFHSETLNFARGIMGRWFNHFSGKFLFFEGDYQNPQHSAPNAGMLLLFDIFLLPLGFITLINTRSKLALFTLLWLFLSPLPAVLSRDQVHSIRSLNMVVPFIIISSFGLYQFISYLKSHAYNFIIRTTYYSSIITIFIICFIYFLDAYFVHLPMHYSEYWGYDYKQIVKVITPIQNNYKKIEVQQSFAQPYIYFLFYQKYDPLKYQKQANLIESEYKGDVGYVTNLENIEFVPIDWSVNRGDHGSLIVGDLIRIPDEDSSDPNQFTLIKRIKYLDGKTAFKIIDVK